MKLNFNIYDVINVDVAISSWTVYHSSSNSDNNSCVITRKTIHVVFIVESNSFEMVKHRDSIHLLHYLII